MQEKLNIRKKWISQFSTPKFLNLKEGCPFCKIDQCHCGAHQIFTKRRFKIVTGKYDGVCSLASFAHAVVNAKFVFKTSSSWTVFVDEVLNLSWIKQPTMQTLWRSHEKLVETFTCWIWFDWNYKHFLSISQTIR